MKIMNAVPSRFFVGSITGTIREGNSIDVRMSTPLTLSRDTDGTWLVYVTLNPYSNGDDATSKALIVSDPAACQALNAFFELIANPQEFTDVRIEANTAQEVA